jgi:tetratricopeptide (TPR) repeat protein
VVVDYPNKSEGLNARLLAHELAHLFGVPHDPAWLGTLMGEKPESNRFSERSIGVIRKMRNYPFALGIDGLSDGSWEKRALDAVELDDVAAHSNALAHAHTVLGTSLINERRVAAALEHFRAAVAADSNSLKARLNLAEAYSRDSQWEKALATAREGVRVAPNDPLAHRALGALLGRNHQPEEALKELQIAKQMDPNNSQNDVLLGLQYAGMFGHLDDAVAALQEAARQDPGSEVAQKSLERTETLKEKVQEAIVKQKAWVQKHPDDPDARYRLAKAEAKAGDLQAAIRDFQKVAELRPGSGTPHTELAELYVVQGNGAAAWEEIRKARGLGTEPPQSLLARLPAQK